MLTLDNIEDVMQKGDALKLFHKNLSRLTAPLPRKRKLCCKQMGVFSSIVVFRGQLFSGCFKGKPRGTPDTQMGWLCCLSLWGFNPGRKEHIPASAASTSVRADSCHRPTFCDMELCDTHGIPYSENESNGELWYRRVIVRNRAKLLCDQVVGGLSKASNRASPVRFVDSAHQHFSRWSYYRGRNNKACTHQSESFSKWGTPPDRWFSLVSL